MESICWPYEESMRAAVRGRSVREWCELASGTVVLLFKCKIIVRGQTLREWCAQATRALNCRRPRKRSGPKKGVVEDSGDDAEGGERGSIAEEGIAALPLSNGLRGGSSDEVSESAPMVPSASLQRGTTSRNGASDECDEGSPPSPPVTSATTRPDLHTMPPLSRAISVGQVASGLMGGGHAPLPPSLRRSSTRIAPAYDINDGDVPPPLPSLRGTAIGNSLPRAHGGGHADAQCGVGTRQDGAGPAARLNRLMSVHVAQRLTVKDSQSQYATARVGLGNQILPSPSRPGRSSAHQLLPQLSVPSSACFTAFAANKARLAPLSGHSLSYSLREHTEAHHHAGRTFGFSP
jgi:hypothetical protein